MLAHANTAVKSQACSVMPVATAVAAMSQTSVIVLIHAWNADGGVKRNQVGHL